MFYAESVQKVKGSDFFTRMGQNLGLFIAPDFATYFFPPKTKEKT